LQNQLFKTSFGTADVIVWDLGALIFLGKIITVAGVSSGIDMGFQLTTLITNEITAQVVQLFIEYDLQPPFNYGNLHKVRPQLQYG